MHSIISKKLGFSQKFGFNPSSLSDLEIIKEMLSTSLGRYKESHYRISYCNGFGKKIEYTNAISALTANLGQVNLQWATTLKLLNLD